MTNVMTNKLDVKAQVIANAQVIVNAQVIASLRQRGVVVTKLESTRNLHYSTGVGQVFPKHQEHTAEFDNTGCRFLPVLYWPPDFFFG
jgi:hypothetical protein